MLRTYVEKNRILIPERLRAWDRIKLRSKTITTTCAMKCVRLCDVLYIYMYKRANTRVSQNMTWTINIAMRRKKKNTRSFRCLFDRVTTYWSAVISVSDLRFRATGGNAKRKERERERHRPSRSFRPRPRIGYAPSRSRVVLQYFYPWLCDCSLARALIIAHPEF